MKIRSTRFSPSLSLRSLSLACACLGTLACSGKYALGTLPQDAQETDTEATTPPQTTDTVELDHVLAPSEISFDMANTLTGVISPLGDVDGDGFGDFAVSEYGEARAREGVHVRYGGPRPTTAEARAAAELAGAHYTFSEFVTPESIEAVGDVDADGFDDFIVLMMRCNPESDESQAFLVYGSAERAEGTFPMIERGVRLVRPLSSETPSRTQVSCGGGGQNVTGVGDLDGDGFDDFVLTDPPERDYNPGAAPGETLSNAYIFYGGATRLQNGASWSTADARLELEGDMTVIAAGDVNGDNRSDMLVERTATPYEPYNGHTFAILGTAQRLSGDLNEASLSEPLALSSVWSSGGWPTPFRQAGDFDGDGFDDLIVQPSSAGLEPNPFVLVFYGSPTLLSSPLTAADADATLQWDDGPGVQPIVDWNGDGASDLLKTFNRTEDALFRDIGAVLVPGGPVRLSGTVDLSAGQSPTPSNAKPLAPRRETSAYFSIGDIDGDGRSDLVSTSELVQPSGRSGVSLSSGRIHIHYGSGF